MTHPSHGSHTRHGTRLAAMLSALVLVSCTATGTPSPVSNGSSTSPGSGAPISPASSQVTSPATGAPATEGASSPTPEGLAPSPSPPAETDSTTKIIEAERAGTIDHDTSLVYQVFASLDYASLPPEYQSSNPDAPDATPILAELSERMDQLAPDLRAQVEPFFMRPNDAGSFWGDRSSPPTGTEQSVKLAAFHPAVDLAYTDADETPVRVWYATPLGSSEAVLAQKLADEIDRSGMWAKERTAMLEHVPCTDADATHNGGNGRLDIYLVYPLTGLDFGGRSDMLGYNEEGQPNNGVDIPDGSGDHGCPVATHIIVNAGLDFDHLKSTTAHELFHAFQYSFKGSHLPDRHWWMEASATWAKDLVYPEQDFEQAYLASYWSDVDGVEGPLDKPDGLAPYAAYLLPFYLVQKSGDKSGKVVGQIWGASETQAPISVIAQRAHWSESFKEFVLWNWNAGNEIKYVDHGGRIPELNLAQAPTCVDAHVVKGHDCLVKVGTNHVPVKLGPTSVQYYEAIPDSPLVELVRFDLSDVHEKPGLGIQAILTLGEGGDTRVEDWTGPAEKKICVDADDVRTIDLVVSNSLETHDVNGDIKVEALGTGCDGWVGTMTRTESWDVPADGQKGTTTSTFEGIWEPVDPSAPILPCQGEFPTPCIAYVPTGTITWDWDSHVTNPACDATLSGTFPAGIENDPRYATGGVGPGAQAFALVPIDETHYGYWGSGVWFAPEQKCRTDRFAGPPAYFDLSEEASGDGTADETGNTCFHTTWVIDATADSIDGSCYDVNNGFTTMSQEWHLKKVGNAIPGK